MNTPTERRATRLLCTAAVLISVVGVIIGTTLAARIGSGAVTVLAAVLGVFAIVVLIITNRAAK